MKFPINTYLITSPVDDHHWNYYFILGCKVLIFLILLSFLQLLEIISKKKLPLHEKQSIP